MTEQPFSQKNILRLCVAILVAVALAGGYYEALNENWLATAQKQKFQTRTPITTITKNAGQK